MISEGTYKGILAAYRGSRVIEEIPERLLQLWCEDYYGGNPAAELVTVDLKDSGTTYTYLFDLTLQRSVSTFGVPVFVQHARDAARMAGHPLSAGSQFHRGHLMAHSIGGGTDINLVPQLGKLNIGEFRKLERRVRDMAKQGQASLYFVRTIYRDDSQTPNAFEQCVILPNKTLLYSLHKNQ